MSRVVITYHESFSKRSYLTHGTRLADFPEVLEDILSLPEYSLKIVEPIDKDWILKVHTEEHIKRVERDYLCSTAWHSVGSVVTAADMIASGKAEKAFALIGAGGHHAGRNYFWGYCCFNDVVIAIHYLREQFGLKRFAIIDTDAHHGDGTRELVQDDNSILHCCICSSNHESKDGTKLDISFFDALSSAYDSVSRNKAYAKIVSDKFVPRIKDFSPDFIFWYFGFDTHRGDYGDIGLTVDAYTEIARIMSSTANEICNGRMEVVLGGGSRRDLANSVIPPVIKALGNS